MISDGNKYISIEDLKKGKYKIFQDLFDEEGKYCGNRPVDPEDLPTMSVYYSWLSPNLYQKNCLKTASRISTASMDNMLLQGVMGMCGESGEAIDIVKKHIFQGHPLDREHLAKELGDVLWYIATTAEAIGYPLEDIMRMNLRKLKDRYGDSFSADGSLHRKEGDV